ncbi:hypothetical protein BASA61_002943 [Batrachochytrium salamandrivorans]|nr:hypothetical protein BASA62_006532 [Batrachochytrium salamandrivorans]KAH6576527.1 hypothetical protein BASA60_004475 [Batrachochytrium salamandrivorans]KAH6598196.1 hypothetical protein BASA61_002943 [Batrachochytrium salamandrivorans]KAH9244929.1 hypothetical protein BASA81_017632 [Batrachochytrium salamandrivorans]KAH9263835.1 hypothetical protein BASA83_012712 [Batrachochytrium salamandrivorans]
MKLISFAIISLLAITVSAQPAYDTTPESKQPPRDKFEAEVKRRLERHEEQEQLLRQVRDSLRETQEEIMPTRLRISMIEAKIQETGLSSEGKWELDQRYNSAKTTLGELYSQCREQNPIYMAVAKSEDDASIQARLLEENYKLLAKYNADYGVQMRPDPGSFYNSVILKIQYNEILKRIDASLEDQKAVNEAGPTLLASDLIHRHGELKRYIPGLQSYAQAIKMALEEMGVRVDT